MEVENQAANKTPMAASHLSCICQATRPTNSSSTGILGDVPPFSSIGRFPYNSLFHNRVGRVGGGLAPIWNSPSETEKAPQGLAPVPEGTSRLQPGISNPWLGFLTCRCPKADMETGPPINLLARISIGSSCPELKLRAKSLSLLEAGLRACSSGCLGCFRHPFVAHPRAFSPRRAREPVNPEVMRANINLGRIRQPAPQLSAGP